MLNNVQMLRALAAMMVVLAHVAMINEGVLLRWLRFGIAGVDLFFVISGFIMVYTTAGRDVTPGQFMLNRIVRILPLYWMLTIAVTLAAIAMPALFKTTDPNAIDLLRSLFFVPFEKSPGVVMPILFLGWTLNYEMFFYALFALSLTIPSLAARTATMIGVLAVLFGIGLVVQPEGVVPAFYTNQIVIEFAFGMAVAYLHNRSDFARWSRLWPPALLVAALIFVVVARELLSLSVDERYLLYGVPSALAVLAAVMFEAQGRRYTGRSGLLIGAASYALYLSHPFVMLPIEKVAERFGLVHGPALAVTATLCLAAVIAVAVGIYRLVELPVTRWLRQLTGGPASQGETRPLRT